MCSDTVFDFTLGSPFLRGGDTLKGFDCWGLHKFCRKHIGLPALAFHEWLTILTRKVFIQKLIDENERGEGRFIKLSQPEPFCCVLFRTKRGFHMGTMLPDCKTIIHIHRKITVLKQDLSEIDLELVGFYNYA